MSPEKFSEMLDRLSRNDPELTSLDFTILKKELESQSNPLSIDEVRLLAEALKANTTVKSLSFSCNPIQDAGIQLIAEMLRENISITALSLDVTGMTSEGFSALCFALSENKTVIQFSMNGEKLLIDNSRSGYSEEKREAILRLNEDRVGFALQTLIEKNHSIETMRLSNLTMLAQPFRDEVLVRMFSALAKNQTLVSWQLYPWAMQGISITGLQCFCDVLDKNKTLQSAPFLHAGECREARVLLKEIREKLYRNAYSAGNITCLQSVALRAHSFFLSNNSSSADIYAIQQESQRWNGFVQPYPKSKT